MCAENFKISIIVPIFNNERFLEKCLGSLAAQTYKNIEVIMIDDGSADGSADICKQFCSRDGRFIYTYQENSGVSAARNKGIQAASGELICFCDSDDWVELDMYETLLNLLCKTNSDIAVIGHCVDRNGIVDPYSDEKEYRIFDAERAVLTVLEDNVYGGFLWNKIIKREIIGEIRLHTDIHIYEDMIFNVNIYSRCNRIAFQNIHKYHYVFNENSAINGKFSDKDWTGQVGRKYLLNLVEDNYPSIAKYAMKGLIDANISIADKLVKERLLNKHNYKRIKDEIKPYYAKENLALFGKRRRTSVKVFMSGRLLYVVYRKFLNLRFAKIR